MARRGTPAGSAAPMRLWIGASRGGAALVRPGGPRATACWCSPRPRATATNSIPAGVEAMRSLGARHGIAVEHSEDAAHRSAADALARLQGGRLPEHDWRRARGRAAARLRGVCRRAAAACSGCIRPPTPPMTGRGTASFSAPGSRAIRPGCRPAWSASPVPLGEGWPVAWRRHGRVLQLPRPAARRGRRDRAPRREQLRGRRDGRPTIRSRGAGTIHGGRSWYTGLGHRAELYRDADLPRPSRQGPALRHLAIGRVLRAERLSSGELGPARRHSAAAKLAITSPQDPRRVPMSSAAEALRPRARSREESTS